MTDFTPTQAAHRIADKLDRLDRKSADARRTLGILRMTPDTAVASSQLELAGLRRVVDEMHDLVLDMRDATDRQGANA